MSKQRLSSTEIEEKKGRLGKLTNQMDIPAFRLTSVAWLNRNMRVRNAEHKNFPEANDIVTELMKSGVR